MRLIRHAGQQHARPAAARQGGDGLAEQALGQLGEQVFLEHFDAAVLPGFADLPGERRHGVLDKSLQTLADEALLHGLLVTRRVVLANELDQFVEVVGRGRCGGGNHVARPARGERGQFLGWCGDQLARAMPLVHQALDQAQALDLGGGVEAFAVGVAFGNRKAIATLPHAQDILG